MTRPGTSRFGEGVWMDPPFLALNKGGRHSNLDRFLGFVGFYGFNLRWRSTILEANIPWISRMILIMVSVPIGSMGQLYVYLPTRTFHYIWWCFHCIWWWHCIQIKEEKLRNDKGLVKVLTQNLVCSTRFGIFFPTNKRAILKVETTASPALRSQTLMPRSHIINTIMVFFIHHFIKIVRKAFVLAKLSATRTASHKHFGAYAGP